MKIVKSPTKSESNLKKFDPNHFSRLKEKNKSSGNLAPGVRRHQNMLVKYFFDNLSIGTKADTTEANIRKSMGKEKNRSL